MTRAFALCLVVFLAACASRMSLTGLPPLHYGNVPTTYASEVPCDTCPLFHYVLNLYPDSTFHWRTATGNGTTAPISAYVDYGRWSVSAADNLLKLYAENDGQLRSLSILSSDRLETRAPDGSPTTWALSYLLTRQKRVDRFDVPFVISGAISPGDSGNAVFTNCFPHRASVIKRTPLLDSIRTVVKRMHVPPGRSVHVSVRGYFSPVPKRRDEPDSLLITAVQEIAYQDGCREVYPHPQLGSVVWKLYELRGKSVEGSIPVEMSVDTLEKSLSLTFDGCRAAGRYRNDGVRLIWFQPYDITIDERCDREPGARLQDVADVIARSRNFRIYSDLLVLQWAGSAVRFVAARFK